jgi:MoaA/NifB/PqqE/SkfB family radical SAM enzyme
MSNADSEGHLQSQRFTKSSAFRALLGLQKRFRPTSSGSSQNALTSTSPPDEKSDTFCVMPWLYQQLFSHGKVKPCCKFTRFVRHNDAPMSLYKQSLDEIWNSDDLRGIRRAMVRGERVSGCEACYREEEAGGLSLRKSRNRDWQSGNLNPGNLSIDALKAKTISDDYRIVTTPTWLQLDVGNLCNLKCRMCQGYSSSRIDEDPIHRQWNGSAPPKTKKSPTGKRWFEDKDFIRSELFRNPGDVKQLEFLGGETLLIKEIGEILQCLIEAGVAENIVLMASTNGSVIKSPWLALTEKFKELALNVSIDGFEKYYEYIRYPARWSTLTRNIEILKERPRTRLTAVATLQAYNALNIVELFRYLDSIGLDFYAYPVSQPEYLSPKMLPPAARRLAMERLRSYAEGDCLPKHQELVLGLASGLENGDDQYVFDEKLMRAFMLFTNDLDVTRAQSFQETHPELLQLISDAGFIWSNETRYAGTNGSLA